MPVLNFFIIRSCAADLLLSGEIQKPDTALYLRRIKLAEKAGVKTGMALWQAKEVCPEIQFVPPRMDLYLRFSRLAHEIYGEYTDTQEAFGVDESWLDVTGSCSLKGDGMTIAAEISRRIKFELGITVSIGVSWNKIFAKLGSDYKKPDAITEISRDNYRHIVWPLPAEDLLFVGPATKRKLHDYGIRTIGNLAEADPGILSRRLGKVAYISSCFANGEDQTPDQQGNTSAPIKSIGNSTTTPRDLVNESDVAIVVYLLAESVAARLRDNHFKGDVVEISIRDKDLYSFTRQHKISMPTNITSEIAAVAMRLFREHYQWEKPIRSMASVCRIWFWRTARYSVTCSSAKSSARNSTAWMWRWTRSGEGLDSMRFSGD